MQGLKLLVEDLTLLGREDSGGEEPLVGGLGRVVVLADLAAAALLAAELADGAKEVVLEAEQAIEAVQGLLGRPGAVAVVADEPAHEQAVALLDPRPGIFSVGGAAGGGQRLGILAIGADGGEVHGVAATPAEQTVVDEFAAVVTVPGAEGEGQPLVDGGNAPGDPLMVQAPNDLQLGPGRGDIDGDEGGAVQ